MTPALPESEPCSSPAAYYHNAAGDFCLFRRKDFFFGEARSLGDVLHEVFEYDVVYGVGNYHGRGVLCLSLLK